MVKFLVEAGVFLIENLSFIFVASIYLGVGYLLMIPRDCDCPNESVFLNSLDDLNLDYDNCTHPPITNPTTNCTYGVQSQIGFQSAKKFCVTKIVSCPKVYQTKVNPTNFCGIFMYLIFFIPLIILGLVMWRKNIRTRYRKMIHGSENNRLEIGVINKSTRIVLEYFRRLTKISSFMPVSLEIAYLVLTGLSLSSAVKDKCRNPYYLASLGVYLPLICHSIFLTLKRRYSEGDEDSRAKLTRLLIKKIFFGLVVVSIGCILIAIDENTCKAGNLIITLSGGATTLAQLWGHISAPGYVIKQECSSVGLFRANRNRGTSGLMLLPTGISHQC